MSERSIVLNYTREQIGDSPFIERVKYEGEWDGCHVWSGEFSDLYKTGPFMCLYKDNEVKMLEVYEALQMIDNLAEAKKEHFPYFHPEKGWMLFQDSISEDQSEQICKEKGIPFIRSDEGINRRVFLLSTRLTGHQFIEDIESRLSSVSYGDELILVREKDNKYDDRAIMIVNSDNQMIGYIPKKDNPIVSRLMDAGFRIVAVVKERNKCDLNIQLLMVCKEKLVRRHFDHSFDSFSEDMVWIPVRPLKRSDIEFKCEGKYSIQTTYTRKISDSEKWDLTWGHRSRSMDDKWNIIMEDDTLYFIRSWTGFCIYELRLGDGKEHQLIIWKNTDDEKPLSSLDMELFDSLMDHFLRPVIVNGWIDSLGIYGNVCSYVYDKECRWSVTADGTIEIINSDTTYDK